ncbi:MAG TPA: type II toxin-antitoxin system VapC family toxin [Spirochaetota bacterium]|nr:type II toxin-antitoxin system VapC family toxin [Spirochaetota bacterium]HPJ40550.1 type II toxin-antitoxin system VapC family toxin [Spirochaetota bacterium]
MKKILLDTNAYSNFLRGDENVLTALSDASIVYMSVFVLGELYAGFKAGTKDSWNRGLLKNFLKKPTVTILDATIETSDIFGEIKSSLRKTGNPIPINDLWIASHCIETGSLLITYDAHFNAIPGLRLWSFPENNGL